jgi:hypothetical protein
MARVGTHVRAFQVSVFISSSRAFALEIVGHACQPVPALGVLGRFAADMTVWNARSRRPAASVWPRKGRTADAEVVIFTDSDMLIAFNALPDA